jgi:hypothetical protein
MVPHLFWLVAPTGTNWHCESLVPVAATNATGTKIGILVPGGRKHRDQKLDNIYLLISPLFLSFLALAA